MVLATSVMLGFTHKNVDENPEKSGKDFGTVMGIVLIALFLIVIFVGVWWVYAMVHFKFPKHYVLVVLVLGLFLDPVAGLIAAYVLREKAA